MHWKKFLFFYFQFIISLPLLHADNRVIPDTLSRTLEEEEKLFLDRNFQLLAAKYELSAADAAIIQAKLYPNPNLLIDQGAYNKQTNKWFDLSKTGETAASLQQVILLAGKRNKQINIAKLNSKISVYQFYDLIRTLRYELHISFYELYYLIQSIAVYDKEIESLKSLTNTYTIQYNKGNISFKELARLLAFQFSLENERADLLKDVSDRQYNLILLTADSLSHPVKPIVDTSIINNFKISEINYLQLIDTGLVNRYDLLVANTQLQLNEVNLSLQKALKVSDITLFANWDRQGNYIYNYNSLSLAINLPIWNRNQGNIKIAQDKIEENKEILLQIELQVKNDISRAYNRLIESDKLYKSSSQQFNSNFEKLLDGITAAYQNHSISLLEFIDYYETYKNSKMEFNKLQENRISAMEGLSLATGIDIFQ